MIVDEQIWIDKVRKIDNIIIYGAGMVGGLVYKRLKSNKLDDKVVCFAVSYCGSQKEYMGKPVKEIADLVMYTENVLVIVAVLPELHQEISDILNNYKFIHIFYVTDSLYKDMAQKYMNEFNASVQLSQKQIDIMMMASDNNHSSGAFLCLVELNVMLRGQGWSTLIILPEYGNGESELSKNRLDYLYVPSYHWCIKDNAAEMERKRAELKKNNAAIKRLEEIIEQYNVKIVHINTSYSYVGAVAAYNKNVPVIWHLREYIQMQEYRFFDIDFASHLINKSAKIIPVSYYIKNAYTQIDPVRTTVVYDGVDVERYYKEREIMQKPSQISIIVVGALFPLKGQEDIIHALHLLYTKYKVAYDIYVKFVGSGDIKYMEYLKNLIDTYGLWKNIYFCGHQSMVENLYWEADIAVMSSRGDAFGRTTVEAQIAGCLVIGAEAGATTEIISPNETGMLYRPGDSDALAEKLKYAIENRDDIRVIATQGQKNALLNFTKEKNADNISKIYQNLL